MHTAPLITCNGAAIPAIGLGTWDLRGEACSRAVSFGLQQGYRHIDTAAFYDNEAAVGEGLRASGVKREEIFVTTKVWHEELGRGALQASAEASLKRMGLSQVDLLLIHWPSKTIPLAETMAALCEAKRRKLAKHIGVSNFPAALLGKAVRLASEPLVANQCEYHPRLDQTRLLAACRKHGVAFVSYCPLAHAGLIGDPVVARIAKAHGRNAGQILLRWHVQQPGVLAVPKSGQEKNITGNLNVFDFALSDAEMAALHALRAKDGRIVNPAWAPAWDVG